MSEQIEPVKRGPGRPKLEEGRARNRVVSVRLNDFGYQKIKSLADRKNLSVAEYTRLALRMLAEGSLLIR